MYFVLTEACEVEKLKYLSRQIKPKSDKLFLTSITCNINFAKGIS